MKKVNKSSSSDFLTEYATSYPDDKWEDFCNYKKGSNYQKLKQQMLEEQGNLCAYCERDLSKFNRAQWRVEHFHDKSDDDPNKNWALDWSNLLLVCLGGSTPADKSNYQPDHLSCDAHKNTIKSLPKACEGYFINPTQIQTIARLFEFDKATGKLTVNCEACLQLSGLQNEYSDDYCLLAERTIDILNLNCRRLCEHRLEVLKEYNRRLKYYRVNNDRNGLQKLAASVFSTRFPEFFTTWRSLLGQHAEQYLKSIDYNG